MFKPFIFIQAFSSLYFFSRTKFPDKLVNKTPADAFEKDNVDFAVTPVKLNPTTTKRMDLSQPIYESK